MYAGWPRRVEFAPDDRGQGRAGAGRPRRAKSQPNEFGAGGRRPGEHDRRAREASLAAPRGIRGWWPAAGRPPAWTMPLISGSFSSRRRVRSRSAGSGRPARKWPRHEARIHSVMCAGGQGRAGSVVSLPALRFGSASRPARTMPFHLPFHPSHAPNGGAGVLHPSHAPDGGAGVLHSFASPLPFSSFTRNWRWCRCPLYFIRLRRSQSPWIISSARRAAHSIRPTSSRRRSARSAWTSGSISAGRGSSGRRRRSCARTTTLS